MSRKKKRGWQKRENNGMFNKEKTAEGGSAVKQMADKGILLVFGIFLAAMRGGELLPVVAMLIGVVAAALGMYLTDPREKALVFCTFFLLCFLLPELCFFLPAVFYDCAAERFYWGAAGVWPFLLLLYRGEAGEPWQAVLWVLVSVTALLLAARTGRNARLEGELIRLRDTSTELNMALKEKNRNLLEKQDNEIYLATLKERNRIAREIHDNVGHMLSRSILQMGALLVSHREEPLHGQLSSVNDTLGQAMMSIRESVHDLHDDSVDLRLSVGEILKPMRQKYTVQLDYDMTKAVPRAVKYCFLGAVKEAMSNVIKHSDATRIEITLREHPVFYQLKIRDNGTGNQRKAQSEKPEGIGLLNMRNRVEALGGTFRVTEENGFQIFISIKKKETEV